MWYSRSSEDSAYENAQLTSGRSFCRNGIQTWHQDTVDITRRVVDNSRSFHSRHLERVLAILDDVRWVFRIHREGQDSVGGKFEEKTSYRPDIHGGGRGISVFRGTINVVRSRDIGLGIIYCRRRK